MNILGITGHTGSGKDTIADVFVGEYGFQKIAFADPIKKFAKVVFAFTDEQLWGPSNKRNGVDGRYEHFALGKDTENDPYWTAAEDRLRAYGREWIQRILTPPVSGLRVDEARAVHDRSVEDRAPAAFEALVEWFYWLGSHYPNRLSPRVVLQTLGTEWGREKVHPDIWVNYAIARAEQKLFTDRVVGVVISDVRLENELKAIKNARGKLLRIRREDTDHLSESAGVQSHMSEVEQGAMPDEWFDFLINNDGTVEDLRDTARVYASCLGLVEVDS